MKIYFRVAGVLSVAKRMVLKWSVQTCMFMATATTFYVAVSRATEIYPPKIWCKGPGWYGPKCSYKCHCEGKCDKEGKCLTQCSHGWFGPYCQYKISDVTIEVDGNVQLDHGPIHLCVGDRPKKEVLVRLRKPHPLNWFRIRAIDLDAMRRAKIRIWTEGGAMCRDQRYKFIDDQFMDVHCETQDSVTMIKITGSQALRHFCSVHVSQGVNYALYSLVSKSTTSSNWGVNSAIDLKIPTGGHPREQEWTVSQILRQRNSSTCVLTFPVAVNTVRINLYNRVDHKTGICCDDRLRGFTLVFRDSAGNLLPNNYTDKNQSPLEVYEIIHRYRIPPFKQLIILSRDPFVPLTLRQVEVFGEAAIECMKSGSYGPGCKYKCHCMDYECDPNGGCASQCSDGWFGPSCQYKISEATIKVDGKKQVNGEGHTCVDTPRKNVTVRLSRPHPFNWLRIRTDDFEAMEMLEIRFWIGDQEVCDSPYYLRMDDKYFDVHCYTIDALTDIELTGAPEVLKHFCSIHVSQGRNYALRFQTTQSSTYQQWTSDHAVDGEVAKLDDELNQSRTCSHTSPQDKFPQWVLTLPVFMDAVAIYIYNRVGLKETNKSKECCWGELQGFELEFKNGEQVVHSYTHKTQSHLDIYKISFARRFQVFKQLIVRPRGRGVVLTLCELELFGEARCKVGFTGLSCNEHCQCNLGFTCIVTTKSCLIQEDSVPSVKNLRNGKKHDEGVDMHRDIVVLVFLFALCITLMLAVTLWHKLFKKGRIRYRKKSECAKKRRPPQVRRVIWAESKVLQTPLSGMSSEIL